MESADFYEDNTNPVPKPRVLDIGTGSGCIALGLKQAYPDWEVFAVDISAPALEVASQNAKRNNLDVFFAQLDILDTQKTHEFIGKFGPFDLIISNPPYICEKEKKDMLPNVLNHEPHSALFVPDTDPLLFYRTIAHLHAATFLLFEINEQFGPLTAQMLSDEGYTDITITKDDYAKDRFISCRARR